MRKLPPSAAHIVMPFFLSIIMSGIVSAISTFHALGTDITLSVWLGAWASSWLVAFPTLLVVLPLVRKMARFFVEES